MSRIVIRHDLPLFRCWFSPDWLRMSGYRAGFWIAPYPEQIEGELLRSLLLFDVRLSGRWPFVQVKVYAPDRLKLAQRVYQDAPEDQP